MLPTTKVGVTGVRSSRLLTKRSGLDGLALCRKSPGTKFRARRADLTGAARYFVTGKTAMGTGQFSIKERL